MSFAKSLLKTSLNDHRSLPMFGNVSNLANYFDLAAIYADQQRNLLESIFN